AACGTPLAMVTLVDGDRQWFKATVGVGAVVETPRDVSFCAHTIQSDEMLVVPDLSRDPRFADNPFVAGALALRFYAAAPLVLPGGERVGTLCVLDRSPRVLTAEQSTTLRTLADIVTKPLLMRRDLMAQTLQIRTDSERAMASALDEMADLFDNAPCGYHSLDAEGRFARINNAGLRWLGCSRDELIGKLTMADFLTDDGRALFQSRFPVLMQQGRVDDLDYEIVSRIGERRRVLSSATVIRNAEGQAIATRTVSYDITAAKRAAEERLHAIALEVENRQLAEVNRVKGAFLTNMSHELRTPLNALIGYAHLLRAGTVPPDSPKFKHYLAQIGSSGRQLLGLIETVLNFAHVDSGLLALTCERVSLKSVLRQAIDAMWNESLDKGIYLTLETDPTLDEVVVDELRLNQMVSHFVSNAIKFSHEGGAVTVRAWAETGDSFRIEVEDSGVGIAEQDMPRLFLPFGQLSEGNTKVYPGAGLGLALTRRLAEAHGGSAGVHSRLGVGSVFWLVLPRVGKSGGR
ncbi:MAG: domain S-box, partial [Rhodoferax sp.]|nr:domain S-box [Rhodoferax sp.]